MCTGNTTSNASTSGVVNWGILGAGMMSTDFAHAMSTIPHLAHITAVCSRTLPTATAFIQTLNLPTQTTAAYTDLQHMIDDTNVHVIYIASVAQAHFEQVKLCVLAGKPVVVEKPLTCSQEETVELVKLAREKKSFLFEGIWTRAFPATRKVRSLLESNAIGDVISIQGDFGWSSSGCDLSHRIWDPISGGFALDIGMYLSHWGLLAFGPSVVSVTAFGSNLNGVDHTLASTVVFDKVDSKSGIGVLQFLVTGEANTEERLLITGTTGRIIVHNGHHIPTAVSLHMDAGRGKSEITDFAYPQPDDTFCDWNYPGSIGMIHEIEEISRNVNDGDVEASIYTMEESIVAAGIIDQIKTQVRGQRF